MNYEPFLLNLNETKILQTDYTTLRLDTYDTHLNEQIMKFELWSKRPTPLIIIELRAFSLFWTSKDIFNSVTIIDTETA